MGRPLYAYASTSSTVPGDQFMGVPLRRIRSQPVRVGAVPKATIGIVLVVSASRCLGGELSWER